ncbi:MAG: hypothetical protein A2X28_08705 [Elusimicrobia bacterium GWA2_56_46]|nr:MAG: hypothetical protein A2X28_08705 [Elusimicrobia bacterium GWA2_56_46]OGR55214.1 MAG: hypothetical protein A2X39_01610 [Elusimicrobia bacterium GWC2_56_31]HBW23711.1 hypothetical protein [Elusimicrobiota bacterium]
MKNYHFLPVFLTLLGSYIGLHFYAASWFSRSFAAAPPASRNLRIIFLLLALYAPLAMFLRHRLASPSLDWFYAAAYAWMGIIFLSGTGFIFADFLKPSLRHFFGTSGLQHYPAGVLAALGLLLIYAFYGGLKSPAVKELNIIMPGLPPAMEGLRIAQISDVHIDSAYKLRQFSKTVDSVNAAKPDLVLFTGDLVDPGLTCKDRVGEIVRKLKPRLGLYGVFGNHEYYFGYEKAAACYREFGIKLLQNEAADAAGVRIIGLGDILTEKLTEKDVENILKKYHRPGVSILMSHQPVMYPLMAGSGDFIGFSGHTHRGQLFPFHLFSRIFYKYFYGLYRVGNSAFYVTSGAGTWGPPHAPAGPLRNPDNHPARKGVFRP